MDIIRNSENKKHLQTLIFELRNPQTMKIDKSKEVQWMVKKKVSRFDDIIGFWSGWKN